LLWVEEELEIPVRMDRESARQPFGKDRARPVLIDINIVSELMRREPDPRVRVWAAAPPSFCLSVISLEELVFGLPRKSLRLENQWLDEFIAAQCEILPLSPPVARAARLLRGGFAAQGVTCTAADRQIAATALTYRLELATRNTPDFEGCGLNQLNPLAL
jgi:predicted nucleic acid-binding protein